MRIQSFLWALKLAALDLALLYGCGLAAVALRGYAEGIDMFGIASLGLVTLTCFTAILVIGGYNPRTNMTTLRYASEHALGMGAALIAAFILTYAFSAYDREVKPGRSVLLLALFSFTLLSWLFRQPFSRRKWKDASQRYIYVAGNTELVLFLERTCRSASLPHPLRFIELLSGGSLWHRRAGEGGPSHPLYSVLREEKNQCEAVVIDLSSRKIDQELQQLLIEINLHAVPVYPLETFIELYLNKISLRQVNLSLALNGTFTSDHHTVYGNVKRLLDIGCSGVALLVLLPCLLMIGVAITLEDGGPALFRQERMGRFERPFVAYKFRTMRDRPQVRGADYTAESDERITCLGRFLRRTRLDEVPQLWNVLKGEMSLIGPRAEWCRLVGKYEQQIPFYHLRHMVKPGITGWAQVNYGYGADLQDTMEKLQYDLYYIKHYSVRMDAAILLKTFFIMLSAAGR